MVANTIRSASGIASLSAMYYNQIVSQHPRMALLFLSFIPQQRALYSIIGSART